MLLELWRVEVIVLGSLDQCLTGEMGCRGFELIFKERVTNLRSPILVGEVA
jgi:hypothetical protein